MFRGVSIVHGKSSAKKNATIANLFLKMAYSALQNMIGRLILYIYI